ncbi:MAG: hypothetical protein O7I42_11890 [Alphaproteobacteria bacterium]|nr:hypothetical protein [Alphaproteobacteria bacterium]
MFNLFDAMGKRVRLTANVAHVSIKTVANVLDINLNTANCFFELGLPCRRAGGVGRAIGVRQLAAALGFFPRV